MRVNVYAEEMTDRIEIISKEIGEHTFTGLRFYLELPVTVGGDQGNHRSVEGSREVFPPISGKPGQIAGPFMHGPGDDDSAAVTFWGKQDLRKVLHQAMKMLDEHYGEVSADEELVAELERRGWTVTEYQGKIVKVDAPLNEER